MDTDRGRAWARGLVFVGVTLICACGVDPLPPPPTGPSTPTPTPTPTPPLSPKLRTFTATPTTITEGGQFTLAWEGEEGQTATVSLSLKGGIVFASGRPATGSEIMKPGVAGYPVGTGPFTYQAKNTDVTNPLEATVTVSAKPNEPPTVRVSAPNGCHPQKWNSRPCSVTCTAEASDPESDSLSYHWTGCATGNGSTGTCTFSDLSSATCTVTVTDTHGESATASKTVQGTNAAPDVVPQGATPWQCGGVYRPGPIGDTIWCRVHFTVSDDDSDPDLTHAVTYSTGPGNPECYTNETAFTGNTLNFQMGMGSSGSCDITVVVTDDWAASTTRSFHWAF
jgi:hypothetical protein